MEKLETEQRSSGRRNCGLTTTTNLLRRSRRQTAERRLTGSTHATSEMMRLAFRPAFRSSRASKATAASCQAHVREFATLALDCNWLAAGQACNLREHDLLCSSRRNSEVAQMTVAVELAPASSQYLRTCSRRRTRKTRSLHQPVFCRSGSEPESVERSR